MKKTNMSPNARPATARPATTRTRARIRRIVEGAAVAALYVALTWISNLFGLASLAIQVRLSEALCVLVFFTPAAIPGLWAGCILANLTMGAPLWDILGGSAATLLGAIGGAALAAAARRCAIRENRLGGRIFKELIPLPTVAANALIIPPVLVYAYGLEGTLPFFALTVGAGEIVSAWVLGRVLLLALEKQPRIFRSV